MCSDCYLSTHLGYANVTGRTDQAHAHHRHPTGKMCNLRWSRLDLTNGVVIFYYSAAQIGGAV